MFEQFPKTRPELDETVAAVYREHYLLNRTAATRAARLSFMVESWLHRKVAEDARSIDSACPTLEIGAGSLNQLPYEPSTQPYDVVEPFEELYAESPHRGRVREFYADVAEVPLASKYTRVTSVACLEHICDLPRVVANAGLVVADNGTFRAAIPNEGRWLWRLAQDVSTGLAFRIRFGLSYRNFMAYEHVNTADEIEEVLRHFFEGIRVAYFGIGRSLSLYRFYACTRPRIDRCREYAGRT